MGSELSAYGPLCNLSSPVYSADRGAPSACPPEVESDDNSPSFLGGWENAWIDLGGEG